MPGFKGQVKSDGSSNGDLVRTLSDIRRWAIVLMLFVAAVINYCDRVAISVALPAISAELNLDPTSKGMLLSTFFWSYAALQVPMGWLVDRVKLRWFYAAFFVLWSLSCGFTGFVGSLIILLSLRIGLGVGESIYAPATTKILSSIFAPRNRGLPTGIVVSGTQVGLTLGAPLIAWIVVNLDWRRMFWIIGFAALLWLVPWLLIFPKELPENSQKASRLITQDASLQLQMKASWRNLAGLCICLFCLTYYLISLITWLPSYFVEVRRLTVMQAGLCSSLTFAIYGLSAPLGGWFADRLIARGWTELRARQTLLTAAYLSGLVLIPALLVSRWHVFIGLLLGASLAGLGQGNYWALLQSCAPLDRVGLWTGAANCFGNLGGVLAPLALGILISRTNSYIPGFCLATLIQALGVLPLWIIITGRSPFECS